MKSKTMRTAAFSAAFACVPLASLAQSPEFAVLSISDGSLGVGYWIVGTDMNKDGVVCGMASTHEVNFMASKPWIADAHAGTWNVLAPAAGSNDYLYAGALNDAAQVVGSYLIPSQAGVAAGSASLLGVPVPFGAHSQAVQWHTDGTGRFDLIPGLSPVGGQMPMGNSVMGFNNNGVCVGGSRSGTGMLEYVDRGFMYNFADASLDVSGIGPAGTHVSIVRDINDRNQICGEITLADGSIRGFFADSSLSVTILPTVFDDSRGTEFASASKLNEAGQVIGVATLTIEPKGGVVQSISHGFVWDAVHGMIDLGSVAPTAINNLGRIVGLGVVTTPEGDQAHALWRNDQGEWIDLNDIVHPTGCNGRNWLSRAPAINDKGEILVIEDWCPDSVFIAWRTYVLVPRPCHADVTIDGAVNIDDLLAVINRWGDFCPVTACPGDIAPGAGDGQVNIDDLLAVIGNWANCE